MAAKAGAEFVPIPMRQDDLADHFADAITQSETLCFNAHGVAKYLLSRAVRDAGYDYACAVRTPAADLGLTALPRIYVGQRDGAARLTADADFERTLESSS